ncbi:periplasmic chaperone for outer membrane proteins Skp [Selenomonas sp. WCT3]|nr:periplasmic chaperone for outer membrane proteins Skp [Selenomonas ruminantium]
MKFVYGGLKPCHSGKFNATKPRKGKGEFEMVKLQKKQVKIISVLIAIVFVGSVVALALTQSGTGIANAASSNVGVVDYNQVMSQNPKAQDAEKEFNTAYEEAQKEFASKTANMNDQEKQDYAMQTQQRLMQKRQELTEPLQKSVEESVKKVAEQKGLSVVLEKGAVVYGGQDITQDVIKQISK